MGREKIDYTFAPTPLGEVLVAATDKGLCALVFTSEGIGAEHRGTPHDRAAALEWLGKLIPGATMTERVTPLLERAAGFSRVPLDLRGTPLRIAVWEALLEIPEGELASYSDIAARTGNPRACRAVGGAVGANPVSVIVPCHRVVRRDGSLGGYHWGTARKRILLHNEGQYK